MSTAPQHTSHEQRVCSTLDLCSHQGLTSIRWGKKRRIALPVQRSNQSLTSTVMPWSSIAKDSEVKRREVTKPVQSFKETSVSSSYHVANREKRRLLC
eukprot:1911284-Pyramimonas_sp.AAC.1